MGSAAVAGGGEAFELLAGVSISASNIRTGAEQRSQDAVDMAEVAFCAAFPP